MSKQSDKPASFNGRDEPQPGFTLADSHLLDVQAAQGRGAVFEHPLYIVPEPPHENPPPLPNHVSGFDLAAKDLSMYLTRNVTDTELTDKDGMHGHIRQDDKGNSITTYDNGKRIYESKQGSQITRSERNSDGSGVDSVTDSKNRLTSIYTFGADGSATISTDSPTEHTLKEWGPGGQFKRMIEMDKEKGTGTISTPGPDGKLITATLIGA